MNELHPIEKTVLFLAILLVISIISTALSIPQDSLKVDTTKMDTVKVKCTIEVKQMMDQKSKLDSLLEKKSKK